MVAWDLSAPSFLAQRRYPKLSEQYRSFQQLDLLNDAIAK